MILFDGYLRMLHHKELHPVEYYFQYTNYTFESKKKFITTESILLAHPISNFIGKSIKISSNGEIRCVNCGNLTKKSFSQGSCYSCFMKLAENDICILKPELCHHHKGTCREPEWGNEHCMKKHTVYFSNTSGIKVGITKENPISKRWVDQGAMFAIPILEVGKRLDAGLIEIEFGKYMTDKTNWKKMVAEDSKQIDLISQKKDFLSKVKIDPNIKFNLMENVSITEIKYPVQNYPKKINSYKLDKEKPIEDVLVGIKGQYLLFQNGVINIRSNQGFHCKFEVD